MAVNLEEGKRAERKTLITVAEWAGEGTDVNRQILGARTEDSSIEFNADIETVTDILGITYSDINKTEPQQSFDPFYVLGGSELSDYLVTAAIKNDIQAYNNAFDVYIITAFIDGPSTGSYYAVKHKHCSIIPQSIGGDSYVSMPINVYYSNDIVEGSVNKLSDDFVFTATTSGTGNP